MPDKKVFNNFKINKFGGNKIAAIPSSNEPVHQEEATQSRATSIESLLAKFKSNQNTEQTKDQPEPKPEDVNRDNKEEDISIPDKYAEMLEKMNITASEAFDIIYNIFYGNGYYEKEYNVFGHRWVFRTMPANYERRSAEIIESISPKTQAMNRLLLITLTLASMTSKIDGKPIQFDGRELGWEDSDFEDRINFVDALPVPVRDAAYDSAGKFVTLMSAVLYTEGANDFFINQMNTNT